MVAIAHLKEMSLQHLYDANKECTEQCTCFKSVALKRERVKQCCRSAPGFGILIVWGIFLFLSLGLWSPENFTSVAAGRQKTYFKTELICEEITLDFT